MIAAMLLAAAAPAGFASGLWRVEEVVQGDDRSRRSLHCYDGGRSWLLLMLTRPPLRDCAGSYDGTPVVHRPIVMRCPDGGTATLTGAMASDRFDVVVRRVGHVGDNPRASFSLLVSGRRIGSACPLSGG